jgi:pimeloyl-ACP methyl ester carboxylesterase
LLSPEYHAFGLTERGHGDSDKPECCYTLGDFAADVDAFMGEQDTVFSREDPERLAAAIPNATLKVYPETGHSVHWERPEQVVWDLEELMKDARPAH